MVRRFNPVLHSGAMLVLVLMMMELVSLLLFLSVPQLISLLLLQVLVLILPNFLTTH